MEVICQFMQHRLFINYLGWDFEEVKSKSCSDISPKNVIRLNKRQQQMLLL